MQISAKFEKPMLEAPQATGIGGDNTGDITNMLWDFAAPTAPPRALPDASRAPRRLWSDQRRATLDSIQI